MDEGEKLATEDVDNSTYRTNREVKAALQELMRLGYLEEGRKPILFKSAVLHEAALNGALEPLDLKLMIDTHRGIALLILLPGEDAGRDDDWSHPLVRRQRLTLEQSLLVALLREAFLLHEQERGVGQAVAKLAVEDLLPKFLTFFPDSGSDNRNQSRLASLINQLKTHGIVSEIDKNNEITIQPLIVHMANADSLGELLQTFQTHGEANS